VVRTFERLGPVDLEGTTKQKKKWDMQAMMEQTQEMFGFIQMIQSQQGAASAQRLMQKAMKETLEE
jgi:hypothetical protein